MQFQIESMACSGCAGSVTKAIRSVDPQAGVEVDLTLKRVTVESVAEPSTLAAVLADAGYPPSSVA